MVGRDHRCAGRGQVDAHRRARFVHPRRRPRSRRARRRPEQPVQRRRDPRRPCAHATALDRPGVFIRSMASRVISAARAVATPQSVRVLDAVGKPWVIVETVGVGQVEVEIASQADTTIVVVNPGWGDEVQAAKAGLLEIADIVRGQQGRSPRRRRDRERSQRHARARAGRLVAAADRAHGCDRRRRGRRALAADRRAPRVPRSRRRDRGAPARAWRPSCVRSWWSSCSARWGGVTEGERFDALVDAGRVAFDRSVRGGRRVARRRSVSAHPLAVMLADATRGRFPAFDGAVEVVPSPGPPCDALVAFTGHFVLAADVDPAEGRGADAGRRPARPVLAGGAVVAGRRAAARVVDSATRCS